jgi:transposase
MPRPNDLSRSLAALEQDTTLIAVIEMSQSSWLVAGVVPGLERQPLKKLTVDQDRLLQLLQRWRDEAGRAGQIIRRIAVAYEAGRDGFWLARWLRARGIEAYVIHPSSVPVSREHRRAKTDRLDTELLKRAFLGWLRGERNHCSMVAIPALEEEDARRPSRERESLVKECTRIVNRLKANSPVLAFAASGLLGSRQGAIAGAADARRRRRSRQHPCRIATRLGPPALCQAADQGDRDRSHRAAASSARR